MVDFLAFLHKNSGALIVIFTAVVTLSTVVYAILTAMLAVETKKMRQVQTEPKIEVVLRPREEIINIVNIY
jgi:flagellar basal body-associated protein FliL